MKGMNVFEEFRRLLTELEKRRVRYALVGGVAMAFYTEPRFTRDIDLLVDSEDFETSKGILEKEGYFESAPPWTFRNVAIELHRFLKVSPEDEMMIDILVALDEKVKRIIGDAVEAESEEGRVMLASKKDLIWLKRARDSKQDQADIERLEDDKNR
jgi:predicted nucleotidyltransferase